MFADTKIPKDYVRHLEALKERECPPQEKLEAVAELFSVIFPHAHHAQSIREGHLDRPILLIMSMHKEELPLDTQNALVALRDTLSSIAQALPKNTEIAFSR